MWGSGLLFSVLWENVCNVLFFLFVDCPPGGNVTWLCASLLFFLYIFCCTISFGRFNSFFIDGCFSDVMVCLCERVSFLFCNLDSHPPYVLWLECLVHWHLLLIGVYLLPFLLLIFSYFCISSLFLSSLSFFPYELMTSIIGLPCFQRWTGVCVCSSGNTL